MKIPPSHPGAARLPWLRSLAAGCLLAGCAGWSLSGAELAIGATDLLHTDSLGVWVGIAGDKDKPDIPQDLALTAPIYLHLRDVKRLPSLAASQVVNGTLTLRLGTESYTTWGPLTLSYDAAQRVISISADRLMSAADPDKPELDGTLALELRAGANQWLTLRRATWTRANGDVVDLRRAIPSHYQSPVGLRFGFVSSG